MEALPSVLAPPSASCAYRESDGSLCAKTTVAKGFCSSHYYKLKRAGAFAKPSAAKPSPGHATVLANAKSLRKAQRQLEANAPTFVAHLVVASENASKKGDSKPAEWALLHSRAIAPIAATSKEASGVTINVGVKVSGTETASGHSVKAT